MVVKDSPEFFYLFWGAIKAGYIPVPLNTLFRSNDYVYIIEDSECAAVFYSPEFKTEVESALSQVSRSPDHSCLTEGVSGSFLEQLQSASLELDAAPAHAHDRQYLRVYIKQLRHKIEPDPHQPEYIITETGVGYRMDEPGKFNSISRLASSKCRLPTKAIA